jgi:hypothetical protein
VTREHLARATLAGGLPPEMLASGRVGINAVLVGFWGALSTVAVKTVRFHSNRGR